ncbi:MAG: helix-turn-helix domain-containing protein [Ruminococcus sp.]|nr:helix-turn-helix domain-containing protein [Ruminococcus sp.]
MDFRKRLKELRTQAGLTQKQLATQIGTSKSVVSFYENQDRIQSPTVLVQLAAVFHVSRDFLLGMVDTEKLDISGLDDEDKKVISSMVELLRQKNKHRIKL